MLSKYQGGRIFYPNPTTINLTFGGEKCFPTKVTTGCYLHFEGGGPSNIDPRMRGKKYYLSIVPFRNDLTLRGKSWTYWRYLKRVNRGNQTLGNEWTSFLDDLNIHLLNRIIAGRKFFAFDHGTCGTNISIRQPTFRTNVGSLVTPTQYRHTFFTFCPPSLKRRHIRQWKQTMHFC